MDLTEWTPPHLAATGLEVERLTRLFHATTDAKDANRIAGRLRDAEVEYLETLMWWDVDNRGRVQPDMT